MGACHHRHRSKVVRHFSEFDDDVLQSRQHHFVTRGFEHQSMTQVVDVFTGAGKVDEFAHCQNLRHTAETLFQPVFNRFHVVVGGRFNGFHHGGVGQREIGNHVVDFFDGDIAECGHFNDFFFGCQGFEPRQFHLYAEFHQAIFRENRAQSLN